MKNQQSVAPISSIQRDNRGAMVDLYTGEGEMIGSVVDTHVSEIVQAVNCHAELVEACKVLLSAVEDIRQMAEARKTCIRMADGTMLGNFCRQTFLKVKAADEFVSKASGVQS